MLDLNVCKSRHCKNLGVANAPEYEYNVRPLGFLSMRCGACSATPPMLDNQSYGFMWRYWHQQIALLTGKRCPSCASRKIKRFGQSANGKPRLCCNQCDKTFSIRTPVMKGQQALVEQIQDQLQTAANGDLLKQLAAQKGVHFDRACEQLKRSALQALWLEPSATQMASVVFTLPYKGKGNQLWGIVTTDKQTGRILHISTTLFPVDLPTLGRYQSCVDAPPLLTQANDSSIELANKQEQRFLLRQQFDRCDFGPAILGNKTHSHALPVLTAHAHFSVLNSLDHGNSGGVHALYHEVFLRGACITQFAHAVKNHHMALIYVKGETRGELQLANIRKLGWWQNQWQEYRDESGTTKAYSVLVGKSELLPEEICLSTANQAVEFIQQRMQELDLAQFTASRVESLMVALAAQYTENERDKQSSSR